MIPALITPIRQRALTSPKFLWAVTVVIGLIPFMYAFGHMVDGFIIPDLPVDVYNEQYKAIFEKYSLINVFLITPQTSIERIKFIDSISSGFIYMVSSASVTGSQSGFGTEQTNYFKRIADMSLKNPQIAGFGISNNETFTQAIQYSKGAIIGSAFIKHLTTYGADTIDTFVNSILD